MTRNQPSSAPQLPLATLLLAALASGLLASNSCVVSDCNENCDPCYQECKCKYDCQNLVAGENGLAIVEHRARHVAGDDASFVRIIDVLVGPSLEFMPNAVGDGSPVVSTARITALSRRVLDVNAELFSAERDPDWHLAAVHEFPERTAVQYTHEPGPYGLRRANSVTFLFDDVGRLLEVTQVVERAHE